jgi:predicted anti-sigma-YlaC factor YlaD
VTCEEFRSAYHTYLDGVQDEHDRRDMLAHADGCSACAAYRDAFAALDADLRHLPDQEIPTDLLRTLERIPASVSPINARVTWRPELARILALGIPAVIAFFIFGMLPPDLRLIGNALLAFAGTLVFLLTALRPIFLSPPVFSGRARLSQSRDGR